jgi:hypothetical protein
MAERKHEFMDKAAALGLAVYPKSPDEVAGTVCAIVRDGGEKHLAVLGDGEFSGEERSGLRLCPLTVENARALMTLFPYTKPRSHRGHPFTIGLGDRLGLATPGHVRAISGYDVFPVFAQQSIRELTLTKRSFAEVIAAAAFGVFQEGYQGGYGADGDHLKTKKEIAYALESGCSMITLDCSEQIDTTVSALSDEEAAAAYGRLPEEVRARYEAGYLDKELPLAGRLSLAELQRIVLTFHRAVDHAIDCYRYIREEHGSDADFELSIDETLTVTTPAEHFVIASELAMQGVKPDSVAPHFTGTFEKGVEYSGDLHAFARDFEVHQKIAEHFGYKLSLHSGSDKFSVFSTVGRVTGGRVHVKTAGTNWLEAMAVIAEADPALYRRAHKYALAHRGEAEKYYHVSTDVREIPDIDLQNDAYLPEYLRLPASRQTLHIAYGQLLAEPWFREQFFRVIDEREEAYYAKLKAHIGKHLRLLTDGVENNTASN